jgi:hypothetical protein
LSRIGTADADDQSDFRWVEHSVLDTGVVMAKIAGKVVHMRRNFNNDRPRYKENADKAFSSFRRNFKVARAAAAAGERAAVGSAATPQIDYNNVFTKFSGGFEGTFASTTLFYGGLDQLIGEPRKDVDAAVREEHCEVGHGFGASDMELTAGNYQVAFTPHVEYRFVAEPGFDQPMAAGVEWESSRNLGTRRKVEIGELMAQAVPRIQESYRKMGWSPSAVTDKHFEELQLTAVELIALRLYTGPCFILYNGVLRSMATGGIVRFGFPDALIGADVVGRFTTTLHCISSGIIKLSRLQPACAVFRGIHGMKL